jgi:hypothetical protein
MGERIARRVFLSCLVIGAALALSCAWDLSSIPNLTGTFLRAVFAVPLLWVGCRGTYKTTRQLHRIRREVRAGDTGTPPGR